MENLNLKNLPQNPGCYIMKDENDTIIYVGKAKNIKKRVNQYFLKNINLKTSHLIKNFKKIDYIITNSDKEAYILENNLIKKYKPYYNIKLVDDKTYPYIVITDDINPRCIVKRVIPKKYKKIYGPFPRSMLVNELVNFLNEVFPFRKCVQLQKTKCIYYDMGQCLGPCIIKKDFKYNEYITKIDNFLKKGQKEMLEYLVAKRDEATSLLQFEKAKKYQDIITGSKFLKEKQIIDGFKNIDCDYIAYSYSCDYLSLVILNKRNGKIVDNYNKIIPYILDYKTYLEDYLNDYYKNQVGNLKRYLLEKDLLNSEYLEDILYETPKRKEDIDCLLMAKKNALKKLDDFLNLEKIKKQNASKTKELLKDFLGFYPKDIEAIDISQLFGTNQIGAIIKALDLNIVKSESRIYKIQDKKDDIACIKDVIFRRYQKHTTDLLLVDGGKTHCEFVIKFLKEIKKSDIEVLGLTKNNNHRLEKIYYKNKYHEFDKKNPLFLFFYNFDEKIHNFAITQFRKQHLKNYKVSYLDKIKGIGEKRKRIILENFSGLDEILNAPIDKFLALGISLNIVEKIRKEVFSEQDNIQNQ